MARIPLALPLLLALALALSGAALAAPPAAPSAARQDGDVCAALREPGVQCGPGNGRRTAGGGEKVSHEGWPAVTGVLWKVLDSSDHAAVGGADDDELLGHHGSDTITGGSGDDILWGDWDPRGNTQSQRDVLRGGAGDDWIYPSHGTTRVTAGPGRDHVWAFSGAGRSTAARGPTTPRECA